MKTPRRPRDEIDAFHAQSFGYALARERDCPLLFIGEDFARTDIVSAT